VLRILLWLWPIPLAWFPQVFFSFVLLRLVVDVEVDPLVALVVAVVVVVAAAAVAGTPIDLP